MFSSLNAFFLQELLCLPFPFPYSLHLPESLLIPPRELVDHILVLYHTCRHRRVRDNVGTALQMSLSAYVSEPVPFCFFVSFLWCQARASIPCLGTKVSPGNRLSRQQAPVLSFEFPVHAGLTSWSGVKRPPAPDHRAALQARRSKQCGGLGGKRLSSEQVQTPSPLLHACNGPIHRISSGRAPSVGLQCLGSLHPHYSSRTLFLSQSHLTTFREWKRAAGLLRTSGDE